MAKFRVIDLFSLGGALPGVVIAGDIVDGVIRKGMTLQIPLNSSVAVETKIRSVEFVDVRIGEKAHIGLVLDDYEPSQLATLKALNICGEVLDVG